MADIIEEYRTIASGIGWIDRSARGRIRFDGRDAGSFLQSLLSNDIASLEAGRGVYATYLTPQGRMIADLDILHRGDWLLGAVADGLGASLATRFDQLIFSEAVTVTDISADYAEIAVVGGGAPDTLARILSIDPSLLAALPELGQADWSAGFVVRSADAPFPMFRIYAVAGGLADLLGRLGAAGVAPISPALAETLRLEAGRPRWGLDLTSETIPLEAGLLERAISTSKGCYVGQEIIIRILHRAGGRVGKRLVVVAFDAAPDARPAPAAALRLDGQTVGHLTSVAFSPARNCAIAFAYVHRDAAEIGQVLSLDGTNQAAEVVGFTS